MTFNNMGIVIKEAKTSEEIKTFISFPYTLYHKNRYYVPPLKIDEETTLRKNKNPAFDHCISKYWLAYRGQKLVGRIAGIINHAFVTKWNKKFARFGWFDFEEDDTIARLLLQQVEQWADQEGMVAVHGPMGFTNFDPGGMLVEGYDQIATLAELYNYPYYPSYVEKAGYQKEVDWVEYKISIPKTVPRKIVQVANIVKRRNALHLVKPKKSNELRAYTQEIFKLINLSYSHLHGMVPLTEKQIQYYTKRYLPLMRKDFISLVIDRHGTLIAFCLTMPMLSKAFQKANGSLFPLGFYHILKAMRINTTSELCLIAVHPEYQGKGVNALLIEEINKSFIRNKVTIAESNPELEDNTRVQSMWLNYEAKCHKRRRCYIKYLEK